MSLACTLLFIAIAANWNFGNRWIRDWLVGPLFCLVMFMVTQSAIAVKPVKPGAAVLSPISGTMVPEDEYAEVERNALEGSAEAAVRLAVQYELTAQFEKAIFWGSIAAENGSQVGAYNLGFRLAQSPDKKQQLRAQFWLTKAVKGGGETGKLAASFLKELAEREQDYKALQTVLPERYPKW